MILARRGRAKRSGRHAAVLREKKLLQDGIAERFDSAAVRSPEAQARDARRTKKRSDSSRNFVPRLRFELTIVGRDAQISTDAYFIPGRRSPRYRRATFAGRRNADFCPECVRG